MTPNEAEVLASMEGHGWITPMRFGGTSGSHHAVTAARMVPKKWVERQKRNGFGNPRRPSWEYRITPLGAKALHNHLGLIKTSKELERSVKARVKYVTDKARAKIEGVGRG